MKNNQMHISLRLLQLKKGLETTMLLQILLVIKMTEMVILYLIILIYVSIIIVKRPKKTSMFQQIDHHNLKRSSV